MAVLKIMNDIQDERQKNEARLWGEVEGVCYKDIDEFCENIPDDDPDIDIRLHCDGGQVFEGWAMYDRLRATGKNISVTVEGNAASTFNSIKVRLKLEECARPLPLLVLSIP